MFTRLLVFGGVITFAVVALLAARIGLVGGRGVEVREEGAVPPTPAPSESRQVLPKAGSSPVEAYREPATEKPLWSIDASMALLEQEARLLGEIARGNRAVAEDLVRAWQRCLFHRPVAEVDIAAHDAAEVAAALDYAAEFLAMDPDGATRRIGIERLAEVDPVAFAREWQDALRWNNTVCAGVESAPWNERDQRFTNALKLAAMAGDVQARRMFVFDTFDHAGRTVKALSRLVSRKPLARELIDTALAAGDPYMLGEMAQINALGYFEMPNPERAYAYSQAYLALVDARRANAWREGDFRLRSHGSIVALDMELASQLDDQQRSRALALADRLADCCHGDGL